MAMTRKQHPVWVIKVRIYPQDPGMTVQEKFGCAGKDHPDHCQATESASVIHLTCLS